MLDILNVIPGKKRLSTSGWYSFNAVCCHHRGHRVDTRQRAGIIFSNETNWSYNCFNCNFKCGYGVGKHFSSNLKTLLVWCGVDNEEIEKLSHECFLAGSLVDRFATAKKQFIPEFKEVPLPSGSRLLDPANPLDKVHVDFLKKRGLSSANYPFYVIDGESRQRLIVPYFYDGKIVGNTSRFYDDKRPKYISEQQRGYLFNIDNQQPDWQVCIVVEGQFDALSIDGCAIMSNSFTDEQVAQLNKLNRTIIIVPDQDKAGMNVCEQALDHGFKVSIPKWSADVKDANDAVVKYGKFQTLLSILRAATGSKILVDMERRRFK